MVRAGRLDRDDRDPLHGELGFHSDDVPGFCPAVEQRCIERAPRVKGARGTPRPGAIGPRAGQLYVYAAGHRTKVQLPGPGANSYAAGVRTKVFCHCDETV